MAWHTPRGKFVMRGAEWAMFRHGLASLVDQVELARQSDGAHKVRTGVGIFDRLEPSQQLALLALVGKALSTKSTPDPPLTAYTEGAVAAVYRQLVIDVRKEIKGSRKLGTALREMVRETCRELAAAYDAENDNDDPEGGEPWGGEPWIERYPPQANSRDAERWEGVIMDTLAEGILWDADYDMADEFLDDDPDSADAKRRLLAIDEDYFAAPPPDATDAELAEIRRKLAKLCGRPSAE